MKQLVILAMLFMLAGCAHQRFQTGVAVHDRGRDSPEIDLNPTLGYIRFETLNERRDSAFFCEHVSAIDQHEDGYGLNACGVLLNIDIK